MKIKHKAYVKKEKPNKKKIEVDKAVELSTEEQLDIFADIIIDIFFETIQIKYSDEKK